MTEREAKTDAEWHEFCRPFVYLNGSHEFPNYPALCRAVRAEALEEAAKTCEEEVFDGWDCAAAIRSLSHPTGGKE